MAEKTAKIRFLIDRSGEGYDFKAGEVYELVLTSCQRWVRRNVASYVDVGGLETASVPHEPAPVYYKGCDGESPTPKVPDLIPLDEETKAKEPAKKPRTAKRK